MKTIITTLIILFCFSLIPFQVCANENDLPIRGIHFSAPGKGDLDLCIDFIRNTLPEESVNTLVLEFGYNYNYTSHPKLGNKNALGRNEVKQILNACRDAKIQLIPQFNCLGHQSWDKNTFSLLTHYPEFDETPGKYPNNEDIYCRSYCTLHPDVHDIIFDLIDELANDCEAKAFHVGMDEVFLIGEDACPRCQGKNKAELFAHEVNTLHKHLAKSNRTMWMWGDRFINGEVSGLGRWEASENDTYPAINIIPKDIVICDWHYNRAEPTAAFFAVKGFDVVSSPWRKSEVALGQLQLMRLIRQNANPKISSRMKGMLHTTWCGMANFIKAYKNPEADVSDSARESANCFKALYKEIREEK